MGYYVPNKVKPVCYNCPFRTNKYCGLLAEHDYLGNYPFNFESYPYCPLIEVADGKTEPTVDKDINVRSKDEPKTQMKTQNSNVISVYDGVSEAVRCAMCSNPNKSVRGCDGACSYDEKLYERIMKAIAESVADTPQTEREGE